MITLLSVYLPHNFWKTVEIHVIGKCIGKGDTVNV